MELVDIFLVFVDDVGKAAFVFAEHSKLHRAVKEPMAGPNLLLDRPFVAVR